MMGYVFSFRLVKTNDEDKQHWWPFSTDKECLFSEKRAVFFPLLFQSILSFGNMGPSEQWDGKWEFISKNCSTVGSKNVV